MHINKKAISKLKKNIVLITSVLMFSNVLTSCSKNIEPYSSEEDKSITKDEDYDVVENITKYHDNEYISEDEYNFYTNLDNYNNKNENEIAVMFSMNKTIDQLKYILYISPLSKGNREDRITDDLLKARYLCRDFTSVEFHDMIVKSIEYADELSWDKLNVSERMYNVSLQIYNSMLNYIKAWDNNDATNLVQSGLNIKTCIENYQPYDFYKEKINSKVNQEIIYLGNDSQFSEIKIYGESCIKEYYDYLNEDSDYSYDIKNDSLCRDDLKYYITNYFRFVVEEYKIENDRINIYALETTKANTKKTLVKD